MCIRVNSDCELIYVTGSKVTPPTTTTTTTEAPTTTTTTTEAPTPDCSDEYIKKLIAEYNRIIVRRLEIVQEKKNFEKTADDIYNKEITRINEDISDELNKVKGSEEMVWFATEVRSFAYKTLSELPTNKKLLDATGWLLGGCDDSGAQPVYIPYKQQLNSAQKEILDKGISSLRKIVLTRLAEKLVDEATQKIFKESIGQFFKLNSMFDFCTYSRWFKEHHLARKKEAFIELSGFVDKKLKLEKKIEVINLSIVSITKIDTLLEIREKEINEIIKNCIIRLNLNEKKITKNEFIKTKYNDIKNKVKKIINLNVKSKSKINSLEKYGSNSNSSLKQKINFIEKIDVFYINDLIKLYDQKIKLEKNEESFKTLISTRRSIIYLKNIYIKQKQEIKKVINNNLKKIRILNDKIKNQGNKIKKLKLALLALNKANI